MARTAWEKKKSEIKLMGESINTLGYEVREALVFSSTFEALGKANGLSGSLEQSKLAKVQESEWSGKVPTVCFQQNKRKLTRKMHVASGAKFSY